MADQAATKQKGIMNLFRRTSSNGPSNGDAKPQPSQPATPDEKPEDVAIAEETVPSKDPVLPSAKIEADWNEAIAAAKAKTSMMGKLKRLTSKSGKGKEKAKPKPQDEALKEEDIAALIPLPEEEGASNPPPVDKTPGSNTLSRRIQFLLSNVPPFLHTVPDAENPAPPGAPPIPDSKLLGYLSSPGIMNGNPVPVAATVGTTASGTTPAEGSGKTNKSVWQVLDRLLPYKQPKAPTTTEDEDPVDEASETSLMLYAPLIPLSDSKVELASSQIIEVPVEQVAPIPEEVAEDLFTTLWPDKLKFPWFKKKPATSAPGTGPTTPAEPAKPAPPATNPVKIWIPSTTEISFQVAWWGFRLWLPPPVMAILSDKTVEATKRAAMITTALSWLISNIPTAVLPPPMKAAVTLLKGIVPILGYIGGFIAWSWGEIKSFDKGHGVVLSATWLLPIALIPSAWEDQAEKLPGIGTGINQPVPPPTTPAPGGSTTPAAPSTPTPAPSMPTPAPATPAPTPAKK